MCNCSLILIKINFPPAEKKSKPISQKALTLKLKLFYILLCFLLSINAYKSCSTKHDYHFLNTCDPGDEIFSCF